MLEVRYEMPTGGPMRGVSLAGPAVEFVTVTHAMPDGTFASEVVLREVERAPAPEPAAQEASPDAAS